MISDKQMLMEHKHLCCLKCISWSAIIAGALVGVGLSFLLNVFSVAIGLTAFNATQGATTFAIGGFIGMLIGVIVSMFFTGWVAGYLGRPFCSSRCLGALYGFIAWCLALILAVILASHASRFVSTHYIALSNPSSAIVAVSDRNATATATAQQVTNTPTTAPTANAPSTSSLTAGVFITFLLFFIGALASCVGGYCGLKPKQHCCGESDLNKV